jgi:hypothetical protein
VTPAIAPAGYSGTPLTQKLGYKDGQRILFIALPPELSQLRTARDFIERREADWTSFASGESGYDVIHGFTTRRTDLERAASGLISQVAKNGMVWISWPKKASKVLTDITEDTIREVLLPTGLVDVKVAAVDAVWSGLKLMVRKELR